MDQSLMEGTKILVADDDPIIGVILGSLFEKFSIEVLQRGEDLLKRLETQTPDFILLDVSLPDTNGYELCRRIRSDSRLQFSKIIFISSNTRTEDRLKGYAAGGDDYIPKPFSADELLAKMHVLSRLKRTEEIAEIKNDFIALISHETMTPINQITSAAELMLAESTNMSPEKLCSFASMINSAGRRLLKFAERSSLVCRLRATDYLTLVPIPIDDWINNVIAEFKGAFSERGLSITREVEPAKIKADFAYVGRALEFVLDNAIRHSSEGSTINISGKKLGNGYEVSIRDFGSGFDPDHLKVIFEPFAIRNIDRHSEGTGLSLLLVKRILELHKGNFTIDSAHGAGTNCRMSFLLA